MDKFCFKCGATVDSDAEVCANCGAPFGAPVIRPTPAPPEEVAEEISQNDVTPEAAPLPAPEAPVKLPKKLLILIAAALAAIFTFNCTVLGLLGHFTVFASRHTDPLDRYCEVTYGGNMENIEKLAPVESWDLQAEKDGQTRAEVINATAERFRKNYTFKTQLYGENFTYSYEIAEKDAINEYYLSQIADSLEETYGIPATSVTKGYELTTKFTIRGKNTVYDPEYIFTVIKIDHQWYMISWTEINRETIAYFITDEPPVYGGLYPMIGLD